MKKFLNEFKEFVSKGSVVDMAVGVIVGGAFSTLTGSLVKNLINPLIGLFIGKIDLSDMIVKVGNTNFKFGVFINSLIEFLIIMFVIFLIVKSINKMRSLTGSDTEKPKKEIDYLKDIAEILQDASNNDEE